MNRRGFGFAIVALIVAGIVWDAAGGAQAQSALDRLESKIRQQLGPSGTAEPKSDAASPAKSGPATGPFGAARSGKRAYLGIVADDTDDRGRGVRVLDVHAGSPGARAGLQAQDLITGLAERRIRQLSEMADILELLSPGDKVTLEVLRGTQTQKIEVTLGEPPAPGVPAAPATEPVVPAPASGSRLIPPPPPVPGVGLPAPGQAVPPTDDRARMEQLERRIAQLEQRVRELEQALTHPPAKPAEK